MEEKVLKTPLYQKHVDNHGKIVPFAGYALPVQFSGVIAEHMAVRTALGLFDVSHMGEVSFKGPDALANIENLLCNQYATLAIGRVRYSPMLNKQGGVMDDVLVYRMGDEEYLMVVNASNRHKDVKHILKYQFGDVQIEDISDGICQIAYQGPNAEAALKTILSDDVIPQKYYSFVNDVNVGGVNCLVSRTGYTGEDGFELYSKAEDAEKLFDILVGAGADFGLALCGLGCRDTLRLEAGMPLYGHEMDDTINPFEVGLGMFVKLEKPSFIGRQALVAAGEPRRARIGLRMIGRGIAREQFPVYHRDKPVGATTSGTHCPYIGAPIAMAIVEAPYKIEGKILKVEIRGKLVDAEVVPLPFYRRQK
ncbi:MAG: glycine cleavage system aminomethyltransferase GcvT [Clostridiales bacterium]|nr:glycine cleavage system aminomethyltransferase GcvT [Clostridiales bacterium]